MLRLMLPSFLLNILIYNGFFLLSNISKHLFEMSYAIPEHHETGSFSWATL